MHNINLPPESCRPTIAPVPTKPMTHSIEPTKVVLKMRPHVTVEAHYACGTQPIPISVGFIVPPGILPVEDALALATGIQLAVKEAKQIQETAND